ncbi:putative DNA topoisomerase [Medicago truncatula]|uniref:DNA topoisomerase I n=1 Tax=Medicago truncatula TaxID=3880 RepID=A0A072VH94_MEDTR|nr:DNA topoisomerase 1 alpha [Medicago truncatula]KEH40981.1 DNA topoisomerase type I [Medicago truncatula]RHN78455.1 putative DNA topoisomerase [Medicago truncatula]
MAHEFDDEDGPVIFKRSSVSKSTQLHSETRKSTSHSHDGRSFKKTPDVPSANGQSSSSQNGKVVSTAKASAVESSVGISKASTSTNLKTYVRSPSGSSKFASLGNKKESLIEKKIPVHVHAKEENNSSKHGKEESCEESEDEMDNIPLSARLKMNSDRAKKTTPVVVKKSHEDSKKTTPVVVKKSQEDSDDDIPLSARRLQNNNNLGKSSNNNGGSDQKKPLSNVQKGQQHGSNVGIRPSTLPVKRPLDKTDSLHSSVKKSKLSDPAPSINVKQTSVKSELKVAEEDDDDDDVPLSQRMNKNATSVNKSSSVKKLTNVTKVNKASAPSFKKKANFKKPGNKSEQFKSTKLPPSSGDGQKKWTTLVHNGIIFPPPYKPHGVKMLYKGKPVTLTPEQEEVATLYAVMRDTEYMQKAKFKENFWTDWKVILGKNHVIQNLEDCDFTPIYDWCQIEKEKKKQMSAAEKKALKEEKMKQEEKYMWAIVDGVKEKVGNFRAEPPGLFRGRGEHPKMGKLKRRIGPSDVVINIGRDAPIPECPIPGESWKEIRHDNTVTWLAYWNDPINSKLFKYIFLGASSSWKGQSDKEKYEKARALKNYIERIRAAYTKDFTSKDIKKQQIAVATYFIDKLALRAGNEKDDDEAADTVGCCTLKVENVTAEGDNKLKFDFLGKDSIRYENTVEVELPVYNAILKFQKGKKPSEQLFDELDTNTLNTHLKELMPNLTAKVFRTFNASFTLDDMLNKDTKDGDVAEKLLVYNQANKQVAIICNHQRAVSKSHGTQISKLNEKIDELKALLKELKTDYDRAKKGMAPLKTKRNLAPEAIKKKMDQTSAKIKKMERDMMTKEDLKTVALGTSKINYLDPRISVAWCKRHEVPIEKIFSKTLLEKFAWAMDVDPDFRF